LVVYTHLISFVSTIVCCGGLGLFVWRPQTSDAAFFVFISVKQVRYLAILASEEGLATLASAFPDLQVEPIISACFVLVD